MRTDNTTGIAGTEHIFFLSYARTPKVDNQADPDHLIAEFFRDLRRSLVQLCDLPMGEGIGFMDREFRPGYKWPDRLARALATCRVFVPLYSPRYFSKENCGKEWFAFASRAAEVAARRGEQIEAIVPALWVPVADERLPEVAQPIQYWTPDYSSRYASHGLYGLMAMTKYEDEYKEVVHELASRILDVAEKIQLDPGPVPDYRSLRNAFKLTGKELRDRISRAVIASGAAARRGASTERAEWRALCPGSTLKRADSFLRSPPSIRQIEPWRPRADRRSGSSSARSTAGVTWRAITATPARAG